MKKIGVITFHDYDNYGAILQSYALQKRLNELGNEAEIIDYSCPFIHHTFGLSSLRIRGLAAYLYTAIGHICYLPRRRKCNLFRKRIRYSQPVTETDLPAAGKWYDCYISGSDQLWDCKLTNFDRTYFLPFVDKGKKKYSYAVSLGEHLPPPEYEEEYKRLLSDYDCILSREYYGADAISHLTGKRPAVVCDPTLLLSGAEWAEFCKPPAKKGKYILVYQLGLSRKMVRTAKMIAKETGCRIEYVPFPLVGAVKCHINLSAGPAEWLGLIRNAEYVLTDSYHGVIFALLFNRPFYMISKGQHINRRAEELLDKVGLSERIIDDSLSNIKDPVDFRQANQVIADFRTYSMEMLKKMIDGEENENAD